MNTRRFHAGAVLVVTTFALAAISACGSEGQPENVSATATPAAAPTSASVTTPSHDAAPTTSNDGQPVSSDDPARSASVAQHQLPTSAGDYSEAFMQAWTSGDKAAMAGYATADVVDKMAAVQPKGALLRTACEDTMCSYSEENGGRVTLTLDLAKVDSGAAKGIVGVKLDLR